MDWLENIGKDLPQTEVFSINTDIDISNIKTPFKISQSLIKMCEKKDHCPKQIMFSFIENKELFDPSDSMLSGRYFESELLGACRGGVKESAKYLQINLKPSKSANKPIIEKYLTDKGVDITNCKTKKDLESLLQFQPSEYVDGEKTTPYKSLDDLVLFAKDCFNKLNIEISKGKSQEYIESDLLSGNIDHRNIFKNKNSIIDVKWTGAKIDDKWNGWDAIEYKSDSILQAVHYVLTYLEMSNERVPFYFFVFGKDKWFRAFEIIVTDSMISDHKLKIQYTASLIREYSKNNYKGRGNFNKCLKCPFNIDCQDKVLIPEIEIINV